MLKEMKRLYYSTQKLGLGRHKKVWTEFVWPSFGTAVRLWRIEMFFGFNK
jgi:hypothetical protein